VGVRAGRVAGDVAGGDTMSDDPEVVWTVVQVPQVRRPKKKAQIRRHSSNPRGKGLRGRTGTPTVLVKLKKGRR
jgi:hypothetical protein